MTWWAYTLYILAILGLFYVGFPLLHQVDSDEEYDFHAERTGTTERGNDANEN